MSNENASRANEEDVRLSQDIMQRQAYAIEGMLEAVMALWENSPDDENLALELVEQSHRRAKRLGRALDSVAFEGRVI